ncbi:MAG TPA: S41 family peptidase, partial [Anaerolineales bacterium]|nr:S41 family peptidase [Anaerolineales bacterium]
QSTKDISSSLLRLQPFDPAKDDVWSTDHLIDDQPDLLPNDTYLFVLIDRNTASAGEDFIQFLRQLDNVVFVGENTRGMNISGEPVWGTLPNSGLSFQLPVDMTLSGGWVEGAGYAPDIWVDPGKALDRVLRFLERER